MKVFDPSFGRSLRALAIAVIILQAFSISCRAQTTTKDQTSGVFGSVSPSDPNVDHGQMSGDDSLGREDAMPAAQLIQILRNNPELMVDVKSLAADAAQQQGLSIQADALTDEQVYTEIGANREFRASVTQLLRARGYVTDEEVQASTLGATQDSGSTLGNEGDPDNIDFGRQRNIPNTLSGENGTSDQVEIRQVERESDATDQPAAPVRLDGARVRNITDQPNALHRPTPYNLASLRDLYTQVPAVSGSLKRFGSDLYTTHRSNSASPFAPKDDGESGALDVPLGPDYVLGPADELSIEVWGGVSLNLMRVVDREGRIALPEGGPLQVAGLTMAKAQALISNKLQEQYRNVQVSVTVSRLRSIRIFVVGDVQRPGAYEVSALASPISALFLAGGPTASGSLRILRHYRNEELVGEIDLYDFMLHGVRPTDDRLESGDTLLVPPVGPQVAIFGAVKRPAIYEIKDGQY